MQYTDYPFWEGMDSSKRKAYFYKTGEKYHVIFPSEEEKQNFIQYLKNKPEIYEVYNHKDLEFQQKISYFDVFLQYSLYVTSFSVPQISHFAVIIICELFVKSSVFILYILLHSIS
jgi:hypothetical protein